MLINLTLENILLLGSILVFCSILISKTGYKFGMPALLMFLLVGMFFGSDGLGLQFGNAGQAQFIGMMALSVILFTGGMDTKLKEIRPVIYPGVLLSTVGVLLTTLLTGLFIFFISRWSGLDIYMSFTVSLLLAATMSSTDSASVFSILRSQKMNLRYNLRPMLELESGSNDPMAYMLTVVLIQLAGMSGVGVWDIVGDFVVQFVLGGAAGFLLGKLSVWIVNRSRLDNASLQSILLLSIVFFTFTVTDAFKGNGYLAVYIAGIVVGNAKMQGRREMQTFFDGLTWLFQIVMFLALGLLVNPHELFAVAPVALLIGLFMIVVSRPLSVFICLLPFKGLTNKARLFVSWVGLRGAVPIIFATYPVVARVEHSGQIFNIVFFITLLSLVVQGSTVSWAARKLSLDLPEEKKGNDFGVELPEEINSTLHDMVVTDAMLASGSRLADISLPEKTLVMIVRRGDKYIVPNGKMELKRGDKLLLISEDER